MSDLTFTPKLATNFFARENPFLNKLSSAQLSIFIAAFLIASIVINFLLLNSNTRLQSSTAEYEQQLAEYETRLAQVTTAEQQRQQQTANQTTRLQQMGGQQQELMALVTELQSELASLESAYQNSLNTAELTNEQLRLAAEQKRQLDASIAEQQALLADANRTIANQQRLIRQMGNTAVGSSERAADISDLLIDLNTQLAGEYSEITLTESSDQTVSIDIPNTLLFVDGDVAFLPSAGRLLDRVSDALLALSDVEFEVVGHADARPIVSDLRFRFPNNWALSSARASLVVSDLVNNGLSEETLTASGKSANAPIREGATAEAFEINRRIEIIVRF